MQTFTNITSQQLATLDIKTYSCSVHEILNKVFGFNEWSSAIQELKLLFVTEESILSAYNAGKRCNFWMVS